MNEHYFFDDFAMVRFSLPPRIEITFEGDPQLHWGSHRGMSQPGWYYRFIGTTYAEFVRPDGHHPTLDVTWHYSDTANSSETYVKAKRAAKKHAKVYEGPAMKIAMYGSGSARPNSGDVDVKGRAWGQFAWELGVAGRLASIAAQIERQKKWEVLIPQKFELEILNRDEVAELVASIAESR